MPQELQPWGGPVELPRWLRRLVGRPASTDTPERVHESRKPASSDITPLENVDRAIFGAWSEGHPGNRPRSHPQV
jgi:hypothetical protein